MRRSLASVLAVGIVLTYCGCVPAPHQSASTVTATASPHVAVSGLLRVGAARPALEALTKAAGTNVVLKVELTADDARVVVVNQDTHQAHTWAMRDGKPTEVDGDTQYVHQATFHLSDFALDDVGSLFTTAARLSGSASQQQLQVVDFYHGDVYMTVTTSPESRTVFFRPDGTPVSELNYHTTSGLKQGLAEAAARTQVATQVVWHGSDISVDIAWGKELLRSVRAERYPARQDVIASTPVGPNFDPTLIQPEAMLRVVRELFPDGAPVTVEIDRRDHLSAPTMTFLTRTRTYVTDLAGNDITSQVRR